MSETLPLRFKTDLTWVECVLNNIPTFLQDHAAAEKKAAGMATAMLSHYPDRPALVSAMLDLAIEEMSHFRSVVRLMMARGIPLSADAKDPYIHQLHRLQRKGSELYFLDRLLLAGIIEARGCERFGLVGQHTSDTMLQRFYQGIAESEGRHHTLFFNLAAEYFDTNVIEPRLNELLDAEAEICRKLPIRAALH